MKRITILLLMLSAAFAAFCTEPAVKWTASLSDVTDRSATITISAEIAPGYHLFAASNPEGGSLPLVFKMETRGCRLDGRLKPDRQYTKEFDDVFEVDQHFYTGAVNFTQKLKVTKKADLMVKVGIKGQACNDSGCKNINEVIELRPSR